MTDGAGLRQSHFGSGYDAGKARLQAEVEQLKGQTAAQAKALRAWQRFAEHAEVRQWSIPLWGALLWDEAISASETARLDAADVPAAPPHEPSSMCVDTCEHPMVCRDLYDTYMRSAASTTREDQG